MTLAMASWWITVAVLIAILYGVPLVSSQVFVTEPRDAEILLDNPVIMRCGIANEPSAFVYWSVPSSPAQSIGPNRQIPAGISDRFTVQGEDESGEFNLMISRVQPEDAGHYVCIVVLDEGRGQRFTSEPGTLTVIQVPTTGNPVCWIQEGRVAVVGDNLSLRCASSELAIGLTWYLGDISVSHSEFDVPPRGTGIDSKFLAQSSANQQTFTCQPDDGQYTACDVTLEVRHPPVVTVEPEGVIETGQDARFVCTATGNPSDFAYTWHYGDYQISFEEHPRFNRARLEKSGSVLVLPDLTEVDDNVTLQCEAVNALGGTTISHVIRAQAGKTLAQIIGPILLGIILGLVLIVLFLYAIWWRRQRRKVRQISKKKSVKRTPSRREEPLVTVDSGIVYTQTHGGFGSRYGKNSSVNGDVPRSALDLESAGYGPDLTEIPAYRTTAEEEREDDGELRPIPRKKSTSSLSSLANSSRKLPSTSADDAHLISPNEDKSFTYYVNPHFDEYRNSALKGADSENDLNPDEEKKHPLPYNIDHESPDLKPINDDNEDNIISTEL